MDILGLLGQAFGGGKAELDPTTGQYKPKNRFWDYVSGGEGMKDAKQYNMMQKESDLYLDRQKKLEELRNKNQQDQLQTGTMYDMQKAIALANYANQAKAKQDTQQGVDMASIQNWMGGNSGIGPYNPDIMPMKQAEEDARMQALALQLAPKLSEASQGLGNAYVNKANLDYIQQNPGRLQNLNKQADLDAEQNLFVTGRYGVPNKIEVANTPGSLNKSRENNILMSILNQLQNEKELGLRQNELENRMKQPINIGGFTLDPTTGAETFRGSMLEEDAMGNRREKTTVVPLKLGKDALEVGRKTKPTTKAIEENPNSSNPLVPMPPISGSNLPFRGGSFMPFNSEYLRQLRSMYNR